MINYIQILLLNYPNTNWSLGGDSYDSLEWQDSSPKPTKEELDALWPATQEKYAKDECKNKAISLLQKTDWTQMADVSNQSITPHLVNLADFNEYRAKIRALAVNPVANPNFPITPTQQWSN
jgi:hypothetical protein